MYEGANDWNHPVEISLLDRKIERQTRANTLKGEVINLWMGGMTSAINSTATVSLTSKLPLWRKTRLQFRRK